MSQISFDNFVWSELWCKLSGEDKLQDKNINKIFKSLLDHIAQVNTIAEQLRETNSRKNFIEKKPSTILEEKTILN